MVLTLHSLYIVLLRGSGLKHIQHKNDWLVYEFKPYLFFVIGVLSIIFKSNVTLTTWHAFIAFVSIATLFLSGAYILMVRSDYRVRASRK